MIVTAVILVGAIGLGAGVMLTVASKVMHVPVDQVVEDLKEIMPGANCGACGFAGCDDYATALGQDKDHYISTTLCPVGGEKVAKEIAEALGVEAEAPDPRVAHVMCQGGEDKIKKIISYDKVRTCMAATKLYGGAMECTYGCIGLGDCARACGYDAIDISGRLASINREKCVGCGVCATVCPKKIIDMTKKSSLVHVSCLSKNKAKFTMDSCKVGCIGCRRCVKACKFDAIAVNDNLAKIDLDKCVNCGLCEKECPTQAIINFRKKKVQ